MSKNIVREKSIDFALRIVKLYKYLTDAKKEFVLSKQILLSGTNIAKHVIVAAQAEGRSGFLSNLSIAMQRAVETEFWLLLLREGEFLSPQRARIDKQRVHRIDQIAFCHSEDHQR